MGSTGQLHFKELTPANAQRALQSKEIAALLVVMPLSQKYLALVRGLFQQGPRSSPVMIAIDVATAIAQAERAYESFDVPKGILRGAPAVPDDDLTTLRSALYLVANKELGSDLIASLTEALMTVRRDLMVEDPKQTCRPGAGMCANDHSRRCLHKRSM